MAYPFGKSLAVVGRRSPARSPAPLRLVSPSAMARKLATYADLLALPEGVKAEVIAGEIVFEGEQGTAPAALPRHSEVQGAVPRSLGGPFDDDGRGRSGGWWIFVEVDLVLGEHEIVRPDLTGWRRERLPRPGTTRPIEVVPDWVCEVLSPSTAARDRVTKRALYAKSAVAHYGLIDPEARARSAGAARWRLGRARRLRRLRDGTHRSVRADRARAGRLFLPKEADE